MMGEILLRVLIEVRRVKESLGWDASNVEACSSEGTARFNTGSLPNYSI
jgi:hypothetical protein